nr:glycosyltransferase [uncultured Deefgea sp.]
MSIILSIIVPIYNVEKYVIQCIDSLLAEKPNNVEIILVNDGSKDQSVHLVKTRFSAELATGQLILLEQENQGVSVARNTGLAHARGEYIGFVDADDLILHGYYAAILSAIHETQVDIVEIGWKTFAKDEELKYAAEHYVHLNFGLHSAKELLNEIFSASTWYPVIRFFKRELFAGKIFPVGVRFCEDMILIHELYCNSDKIYQIKKPLYAYRMNPAGATMSMSREYMKPLQDLYIALLPRKEFHIDLLKIAVFYVLYRCMQNTNSFSKLDNKIEKDLFAMRLRFWRYTSVGSRRFRIFMFPRISNFIYQFKQ